MSKNDGGPAFPLEGDFGGPDGVRGKQTGPNSGIWEGMTLRDYFAAKAMQACLAVRSDNTRFWSPEELDRYASDFYAMADAMLAERSKP